MLQPYKMKTGPKFLNVIDSMHRAHLTPIKDIVDISQYSDGTTRIHLRGGCHYDTSMSLTSVADLCGWTTEAQEAEKS